MSAETEEDTDMPQADRLFAQDSGAVSDAFTLLARWNYSLTAFYVRRWQRQMELPLRLAGISSPGALMEARRAFEEDLVADYFDQAEALHHTCAPAAVFEAEPDYRTELLKAQDHARELIEQAKAQAERIIQSARTRADEIVAQAAEAPAPPPQRRKATA
jgi:hypothetical protein